MTLIWAVGLMTGTVLDGNIDVAAIRTDGESVAAFGPWTLSPYPPAIRPLLADALTAARAWGFDGPEPPIFAAAEAALTRAQAAAASAFIAAHRLADVAVIGFHGQTVLHRPPAPGLPGRTRQLGDGPLLAALTGAPVVYDFRSADVAAGGQGAPLAASYHRALLGGMAGAAVLNLGGVGNLTALAGDTLVAFDTGPANAPVNDWVERATGRFMDADGALARQGRVDEARLARLLDHPYFAAPYPKSLDRFGFTASMADGLSLPDGAALLTAFAAAAVGRGLDLLPRRPARLIVCGGGRRNPALMDAIRQRAGADPVAAEAAGWRGDAVEAECFAFLAVRALRGLPISFPSTTGVPAPMPGGRIAHPAKQPHITAMDGIPERPPSVERLLGHPGFVALAAAFGRTAARDDLRAVLSGLRAARAAIPDAAGLAETCRARLAALAQPSLRPVFNLTGTVLHTNLGRAMLPPEALAQIAAASGACTLEYDLDTGARGHRDSHLEPLLCRLTGAEAATVVNNNAAAVLLVLNTLAQGREAIVSRGELVEIGGSFRIPEIMARAGARLREVGATNRTHPADYQGAIGADTALAMKVHTSNYVIQGFTAAVPEPQLAAICRAAGIPFVNDLGSGTLVDLSAWGLPREPTVRDAALHADLVTFSGDKLLGGVQAGCIVGRADLVALIRRNPLARALRLGKLSIAALEAVLRLYLHPERLAERLPALRLLTRPQPDIEAAAHRLQPALAHALGPRAHVRVAPCCSEIGSGALPLRTLPSACLAISRAAPGPGHGGWLERTAAALRRLPTPVIGRIADDALRLDLRTLEDEPAFVAQLPAVAQDGPNRDARRGWPDRVRP